MPYLQHTPSPSSSCTGFHVASLPFSLLANYQGIRVQKNISITNFGTYKSSIIRYLDPLGITGPERYVKKWPNTPKESSRGHCGTDCWGPGQPGWKSASAAHAVPTSARRSQIQASLAWCSWKPWTLRVSLSLRVQAPNYKVSTLKRFLI